MSTDQDTSVRDILLGAADYIEKHGWRQGGFGAWGGRLGPCCAAGAIGVMTTGEGVGACALGTAAKRQLAAMVTQRQDVPLAECVPVIADWNDAPERTKDEVVAKLREAAEAAS